MDARTAAHALRQIAALLELRGESRFKSRAYEQAARALLATGSSDLGPLLASGQLEATRGLGPATLAVVRDLVERGESRLLERLRTETPEGLEELLRLPGLGSAKIHQIHEALGVRTLDELEEAARDGRLAALPRFGTRTAERVLAAIATARESGTMVLYHHGAAEARHLLSAVRGDPRVVRAEIAGSIRRRREVIGDVDIVAACAHPTEVADSFGRLPGVRDAKRLNDEMVRIRFVDGARLDLCCVTPEHYGLALWRATGSDAHLASVEALLASKKLRIDGDRLLDAKGRAIPTPDERAFYAAVGLPFIEPELREGLGEAEVGLRNALPELITGDDIQGVLHCHTKYSDGTATIREMAKGAMARGWSYLGISDHSQAAFYAGGLKPDEILAQHAEIDEVNRELAGKFRVLKGIEADILADGKVDYDAELLARFDFVIGSIHSRFKMGEREMTDRVLAALEDPHLTVLAHPTGRLLRSRDPYGLDIDAVLEKALAFGVAVELNCDPHRMDLDWRYIKDAMDKGCAIEIGPDAHSIAGLDYMDMGIGSARKGWVTPDRVLNARDADGVVAFAKARRTRRASRPNKSRARKS